LDAKSGHALKKADGIGHGDIDIRLLHSVAETGIEQLDFSGFSFVHVFLFSMANTLPAKDSPASRLSTLHHTFAGVSREAAEPRYRDVECARRPKIENGGAFKPTTAIR
jgi:hypothetical protein